MSGKVTGRFGFLSDLLSVGAWVVWAVTAAFAAVSSVMTWVASSIDFIWDLGWGAAVFAGIGTACFIALVLALVLVAAAAALTGWRRFRPLPVSAQPVTTSLSGLNTRINALSPLAKPPSMDIADLKQQITDTRQRVAELTEKTNESVEQGRVPGSGVGGGHRGELG